MAQVRNRALEKKQNLCQFLIPILPQQRNDVNPSPN